MKKILLSLITITFIYAEQLEYSPINKDYLSEENGGILKAIDAYSDGVGFIVDGKIKLNNYAMNDLVFKYGEKSKNQNTELKSFIEENGNNDEIIQSNEIGNIIKNKTPNDGTVCDDGNAQTINDIYLNGICVGNNVEGQTCTDNNINTVFDIYKNGVCKGIIVTQSNLKSNGFSIVGENKTAFSYGGYDLSPLNNLTLGIIGIDQNNNYVIIPKNTWNTILKYDNFDNNNAYSGDYRLGLSLGNHNGGGRYDWRIVNYIDPSNEISNTTPLLTSRTNDGVTIISVYAK